MVLEVLVIKHPGRFFIFWYCDELLLTDMNIRGMAKDAVDLLQKDSRL